MTSLDLDLVPQEDASAGGISDSTSSDGLEDFLTGDFVKDTPKERVRQRIVRALSIEYVISLQDFEFDYPVPIPAEKTGGRNRTRKVEIAIFSPNSPHTLDTLDRIVICRPEPNLGRKTTVKIRDHEQAAKDLDELRAVMSAVPCNLGLWTNGLDFFFLFRELTRTGEHFYPRADWPIADDAVKVPPTTTVDDFTRRADPYMLRMTFRRCHNYIHGNEGMPKDAAFWQFLYLIFAKMQDEQEGHRRFVALPAEPYSTEGRRRIRERIDPLFLEVRERYGPASESPIFRGNEEITLSDAALAFLVAELQRYDLLRTDIDAKGVAYQELVGANLRGDRGQYFTPRGAIRLMVEMMGPDDNARVMDPSCGTGGFLVEVLNRLQDRWRTNEGNKAEFGRRQHEHTKRLRAYAETNLFGADFDPFLVRATSMNILMMTGATGHVFHMDSLAFPNGHLPGNAFASKYAKLGTMDLVLSNPPFGADIPISDPHILDHYGDGIAKAWRRDKEGKWRPTAGRVSSAAPELLFIQRCVEWLKDGGRLGIVLPSGILSNPGDAPVRQWIISHCWILAVVDLPVETFVAEANVNIYTSLLFLKKKSPEERAATVNGGDPDYPVFMAVAERVGYDRRGNPLFKREPDGQLRYHNVEYSEYRIKDGAIREHRKVRREKIEDNDLPEIAEAYRDFRSLHSEPTISRLLGVSTC